MTTTEMILTPQTRERIAAVIDFEKAIERFRSAVLAGDAEFIDSMTSLVDNMIGGVS